MQSICISEKNITLILANLSVNLLHCFFEGSLMLLFDIIYPVQVYNNAVKDVRKEMDLNHRPAGVIPPCSTDLKEVHYTFDFSQALSIPHHARQEGPLYFLTPRKVQLFGVAIEGQHHQINYLIDEDQGIGENGAGIKGANGVVSMLHHCLTTYGSGEKSCVIHCDNCAGTDNKQDDMN